jgi:hypothetical protein
VPGRRQACESQPGVRTVPLVELSACAGGKHDRSERRDPRGEQLELGHCPSSTRQVRSSDTAWTELPVSAYPVRGNRRGNVKGANTRIAALGRASCELAPGYRGHPRLSARTCRVGRGSRERIDQRTGKALEVLVERPRHRCVEHRLECVATDPGAARGGSELGDRPAGDGDREPLAGLGTAQDLTDVVTQFLLGNRRHETYGRRSATRDLRPPAGCRNSARAPNCDAGCSALTVPRHATGHLACRSPRRLVRPTRGIAAARTKQAT